MSFDEIAVAGYRLSRQPGGATDAEMAAFYRQLSADDIATIKARLPSFEEPAKRCFITRTIKEFLERCLAAPQQEGEAATKA